MGANDNAELIRRANEAFASGDFQAMADLLADDVVWHEIGRAEPRRGKTELAAMAGSVDYEIDAKVHDVTSSADHVVALVDATGKRGGRTLHYRVAEVYHVRDGRITERWAMSDDTAAITEFFA